MSIGTDWWWKIHGVECPIHRASISVPSLSGSSWRFSKFSFSLLIYCNLYCNIRRRVQNGSMSRSFHRSRLINTSPKIDVDWYWWWKIHDVKYSIPRASISVPSQAVRSNRTSASFLSLSVSPTFSLFLLDHSSHPPISPYLSDCTLLPLVNVTRSRSPTKNLQQRRAPRSPLLSVCHGRLGPWTMLYLVWTDGRQARVRLPVSSSIAF